MAAIVRRHRRSARHDGAFGRQRSGCRLSRMEHLRTRPAPGFAAIELEKTGYLTAQREIALSLGKTTYIKVTIQPDAETAEYREVADATDPSQLRQYSQKYPASKNTTQVRNRLEEIEWKNVMQDGPYFSRCISSDQPEGLHANEARGW